MPEKKQANFGKCVYIIYVLWLLGKLQERFYEAAEN